MPPNRKATAGLVESLSAKDLHVLSKAPAPTVVTAAPDNSNYWDWNPSDAGIHEATARELLSVDRIEANLRRDAQNRGEDTTVPSHDDYWRMPTPCLEEKPKVEVDTSHQKDADYWTWRTFPVKLSDRADLRALVSSQNIEDHLLRAAATTASTASSKLNPAHDDYWAQ